MERIIKAAKITVEIETNKQIFKREFTQDNEESIDETLKRVEEIVVEFYESLA